MAAGDFKIMRNASNTDSVPNAGSDLLLLWDTAVDNEGTNITYSSGTFTLGETGKFLVMVSDYVSTTDTTNNERFNFKMTLTLDGTELLEGYSAEYIRKSGGNQGAIQTSLAIIDVTTTTGTGDELQVRTERIDNSTTGTLNRVGGDRSGISIIKLDDTSGFGLYRNSSSTNSSDTDNAAVTLNIQTEDQQDSPFTRTTNTVDIATNNLVLAIYSLQSNVVAGRSEFQGRLTLNGTPVPGSYGHIYRRNIDNSTWGGCSAACLLEPTSGDDLELEVVTRDLGGSAFENTLQLIELPSGAEAAIMEATTGNFNVATTDFTWDTLPYIDTAAFTATAGNANIDVDNADDYLVFASQASLTYTAANRSTAAMQFRVNTTDNETIGRSTYVRGIGTAGFGTLNTAGLLNGLSANDSIYVRNDRIGTTTTTVTNEVGAFSVIRLSSLFAGSTPTLTTQAVSSINETTATGNGNITDLGTPNPTSHGVCWDTSSGSTISDNSTDEGAASATGAFTSNITGLTANTLYYVKAYATNTAGTSYGGEVTFTTLGEPTVTTQAVSDIDTTTATGNGNITDLGNPNPTSHGVCWDTSSGSTISDNSTDEGAAVATGAFTTDITGLTDDTLYYVRAYATNSQGTVYGGEVSFTTDGIPALPTITTQAVTSIGNNSATGNGNITDLGYPDPTAHGMCWNTIGTPTTSDSTSDEGSASATGPFTSDMTSLESGTTYYVRAYAINSQGTVYGSEVDFTTTEVTTQGMQLASADKSQVSSGAENPGTFNFTESLPWGAITIALRQANSTTVGSKFTTITLPNLTLMNEAKISNVNINGDVIVDSRVDLDNLTIDGDMEITNAGVYYFSNVTVTGDVTNSDSGGNVQIIGSDGTTLTTSEPGTGNDEVDIQIISVTTIINLKDNTEIRIYEAGTTTEVTGIEIATDGTTDNRRFSFTHTVGSLVDIVVFNIDYIYERLSNYTILSDDSELPFQQEADINYLNP